MLLDNKSRKDKGDHKVIDFISRNIHDGKFDLVTGYFTVSALAELYKRLKGDIKFRLILGNLVKEDGQENRIYNLISDEIKVDSALNLSGNSQLAIKFLEQDFVEIKTIQSAFCHAKTYIYEDIVEPQIRNFNIIGSSNLTATGLGVNESTSNIELNYASTGDTNDFIELQGWFKNLWEKVAKEDIKLTDGKKEPLKNYIIELIKDLYLKYTPLDLYHKVLYELFKRDLDKFELDPDFNFQIGHLRTTKIWNALYSFQQKGVMSLIKMMKSYNGAILADAVGLGKTWEALAVMKYFEISEGSQIVLICPKKLSQNWEKYLKRRGSRFEADNFDYVIRYHTDLQDERINRDGITLESFFQSDKPKLIVIDESHNFRNDKSQRYDFLVEQLLKPNKNIKVLLLSATPINNSLNDVRNQFKLLVKGSETGFKDNLGVPNLLWLFKETNKIFKKWKEETDKKLSTFIKMLPPLLGRLTDALVLARTRELIKEIEPDLKFPVRNSRGKDDNIFITPENIGSFTSFDDLFKAFPPKLCGYQPSNYITVTEKKAAKDDEQLQDRFLVKMMYILLTKRLESSWYSLLGTTEKILQHHLTAKVRLEEYKKKKEEIIGEGIDVEDLFEDDESELNKAEFSLGKREIKYSEIDKSGNLKEFEKDINKDIAALEKIRENLVLFSTIVDKEMTDTSIDTKLEKLISLIREKWNVSFNNGNKKILIFTAYKDTAYYLYNELRKRGFSKLAVVTGSASKVWDNEHEHKAFEFILERFAPYTKLYQEKEWDFERNKDLTVLEDYENWKDYIKQNKPTANEAIVNDLEILIATDCLSEGQNLQDADMVINYDVHWNPVRILQRMGRIDRIGSPNLEDGIFGINFWPSDNIENYIKLRERVEDRMVQMKIAGVEVDKKLSDELKERLEDEELENKEKEKMMQQMQISWNDIETGEETFGFDDLSLEAFRQELYDLLRNGEANLKQIPNGVYTGFKIKVDLFNFPLPEGLIALMGYPSKPSADVEHIYKEYYLAYATSAGKTEIVNQKDILTILRRHKNEERNVVAEIDHGNLDSLQKLKDALSLWLDEQGLRKKEEVEDDILKRGNTKQLFEDSGETQKLLDEKFNTENIDLICWFVLTP